MSYRIHIGIVRKKDLDEHLSKSFSDSDDDYDKKWGFFNSSNETELSDETPIEQFKIAKGYEEEEYPPYVLTKKDFQKILNYYKQFLKDSHEKKEKELDELGSKDDIDRKKMVAFNINCYYIKSYFDGLLKKNINIDSSGLFLLDYFYLVRMYENWKNGDRAIITHG